MNLHCKKICWVLSAVLALMFCASAFAQGPTDLAVVSRDAATATVATAIPDAPAPTTPDQAPGPVSRYPTGSTGGDWRLGVSIYGWFPALHGTVGALGHDADIHSSFSDIFHVLKGIIPIAVEADKGRFVMPVDFLWLKLGVNNGIPIEDFSQISINTHMTQSIFTPKAGYRLYDGEKLKFDALGGIRYWYVGINNTLEPSGRSNSRSVNFVDGLGGGRFILPFGEKAAVTVAGDAGAGASDLDYQVVGLLNLNFTRKLGMGLGWRYLYEDYRPTTHQFVYNPTMSGPLAGLTFNSGGKPPVPPTVSCSASPAQVFPGDPVTVTATAQGLNPKLNTLYAFTGEGVSGSGSTANVNTSGLNPGTYTVTGNLKEGKPGKEGLKPWETASCSATYTVKEFEPPTISCSANPSAIKPGDTSTISATGVSPQNRPLTYTFSAASGAINGNGPTATFSSSGAPTGNVPITCNVSDDKGHTVSGNTSVAIVAPPPPPVPHAQALCSVSFANDPKRPTRVDNEGKACLDQVALSLQQQSDSKLVIVASSTSAEKAPPKHARKGATVQDVAAQCGVNAKDYLVKDKGIDPSRVSVATTPTEGQQAQNYLVPAGANFAADVSGTTPVDESTVKPQERKPLPEKHHSH